MKKIKVKKNILLIEIIIVLLTINIVSVFHINNIFHEKGNYSNNHANNETSKTLTNSTNTLKTGENIDNLPTTRNTTNTSKTTTTKKKEFISKTEKTTTNSNNTNNDSENELEKNQEDEVETPPVEEDKNNNKRKIIENTFGIKILYGNEIGNYKPKGITPTKLTDSKEIEKYLNKLNTELAKYPENFFKDFNKKGMPLTIYLIKSSNGSFSGFTDYQFMNDIKLTLTTDYDFEYTIHHEMMHYIDCYLDIVMYPNNPYDEYELLNPSEFVYGYASTNQIYNMASNQRGAYFISSYAATHVKEDRAEVFKYMTARAYKPIGCFEENEVIRKKAELISRQIKDYFPSVTESSHWDRFIK